MCKPKVTEANKYFHAVRRLAALTVTATGYLAVSLLLHWSASGLTAQVRADGPAPLDAQIGVTAAAAGWLVLTWLGVSTLLALAMVGPGASSGRRPRLQRLAQRVTPALVHRAAATMLGAGLGVGLAGGSLASPFTAYSGVGAQAVASAAAAPRPDAPVPAHVPDLDRPADPLPGWTPDRPASGRPPTAPSGVHLVATVPLAGRAVADEVVVRRGDTLWDIAARHLGPDATAAEIAVEWPRWHRANGEVIGPRPDHILPGQRLRPPAVASHPDPRSPR